MTSWYRYVLPPSAKKAYRFRQALSERSQLEQMKLLGSTTSRSAASKGQRAMGVGDGGEVRTNGQWQRERSAVYWKRTRFASSVQAVLQVCAGALNIRLQVEQVHA